jgi:hypothetical protein
MKNILALDLGTSTGYAFNPGAKPLECGSWELATKDEITQFGKERLNRRRDPRVLRLKEKLLMFRCPDIVVFEDVQFATSTYQVQLWSAFRSAVWLTFPHILIDCVPVATLKLFATGHGGATKSMMASALRRKHPDVWNGALDDDAIDAAWVWLWAKQNLGRVV